MPNTPEQAARFAAALRRIEEQVEQSKANARILLQEKQRHEDLKGLLMELPGKLEHPIMVPFGPLAFFRGHMEHTNEVLQQIGCGYFVEQTAKGAISAVDRRMERLQPSIQQNAAELRELQQHRRVAAQEAGMSLGEDIPLPADAPPGTTVRQDEEGYLDIREPLEAEDGCEVVGVQTAPPTADEDPWSSAISRLRELELQEERDELGDLDDLLEAYDASSGICSAPKAASSAPQELREEPPGKIKSPADIFAMMRDLEEAEAAALGQGDAERKPHDVSAGAANPSGPREGSALKPASVAAPGVQERQGADPARRLAQTSPAFTGHVLERGQVEVPTGGSEAGAGGEAQPKRVSKFKADRQRRGLG